MYCIFEIKFRPRAFVFFRSNLFFSGTMQGFANETGSTLGIEKSTVATTYQAHFHKLGASHGWTSAQLPTNLLITGKCEIELELVDSSTGYIHN